MGNKVRDLVTRAISLLESKNPEGQSLWRAYVAVEYAILDLKLQYNMEHESSPPALKRTAKKEDLLSTARSILLQINTDADKKALLYDLRSCRNALKALVAKS